jgi:hypothetical protein
MRGLPLSACLVLLLSADGSALAASACGKGMLWPYVRQPGDCLTDDEIKAGQSGVYNGPVNTNPDLSGVRVETPAQSTGVTGPTGPAPASPSRPATPNTAAGPVDAGPALNGPGFTPAPVRAASAPCSKGWLWPFVRSPGDCLTDAERANGESGVYRAGEVVASAAPATAATVTAVSTAAPAGVQPEAQPEQPAASEVSSGCRKGLLWPFVRRPGDCPTDVERGRK